VSTEQEYIENLEAQVRELSAENSRMRTQLLEWSIEYQKMRRKAEGRDEV
jgi:hypothetical protein